MSKRKAIDITALQSVAGTAPTATDKLEGAQKGRAPSRVGKVQIGAFVPPELRTRLKVLSAEQDRPIGDMIEEALTDYLTRHGK